MNARRIPRDGCIIGTSRLFGKAEDGSHLQGGLAPSPFGGHRQGTHNGVRREEEVVSWAFFRDVSVQVQGKVVVHLRGKLQCGSFHGGMEGRRGRGIKLGMDDGVIWYAAHKNRQNREECVSYSLELARLEGVHQQYSLAFAGIIRCDVRRYSVKR